MQTIRNSFSFLLSLIVFALPAFAGTAGGPSDNGDRPIRLDLPHWSGPKGAEDARPRSEPLRLAQNGGETGADRPPDAGRAVPDRRLVAGPGIGRLSDGGTVVSRDETEAFSDDVIRRAVAENPWILDRDEWAFAALSLANADMRARMASAAGLPADTIVARRDADGVEDLYWYHRLDEFERRSLLSEIRSDLAATFDRDAPSLPIRTTIVCGVGLAEYDFERQGFPIAGTCATPTLGIGGHGAATLGGSDPVSVSAEIPVDRLPDFVAVPEDEAREFRDLFHDGSRASFTQGVMAVEADFTRLIVVDRAENRAELAFDVTVGDIHLFSPSDLGTALRTFQPAPLGSAATVAAAPSGPPPLNSDVLDLHALASGTLALDQDTLPALAQNRAIVEAYPDQSGQTGYGGGWPDFFHPDLVIAHARGQELTEERLDGFLSWQEARLDELPETFVLRTREDSAETLMADADPSGAAIFPTSMVWRGSAVQKAAERLHVPLAQLVASPDGPGRSLAAAGAMVYLALPGAFDSYRVPVAAGNAGTAALETITEFKLVELWRLDGDGSPLLLVAAEPVAATIRQAGTGKVLGAAAFDARFAALPSETFVDPALSAAPLDLSAARVGGVGLGMPLDAAMAEARKAIDVGWVGRLKDLTTRQPVYDDFVTLFDTSLTQSISIYHTPERASAGDPTVIAVTHVVHLDGLDPDAALTGLEQLYGRPTESRGANHVWTSHPGQALGDAYEPTAEPAASFFGGTCVTSANPTWSVGQHDFDERSEPPDPMPNPAVKAAQITLVNGVASFPWFQTVADPANWPQCGPTLAASIRILPQGTKVTTGLFDHAAHAALLQSAARAPAPSAAARGDDAAEAQAAPAPIEATLAAPGANEAAPADTADVAAAPDEAGPTIAAPEGAGGYDIAGIQIGLPRVEAERRIRAAMDVGYVARVDAERAESYGFDPAAPFHDAITYVRADGEELISVVYGGSDARVAAIGRIVRSAALGRDTALDLLSAKYGPPLRANDPNMWVWTEHQGPIPDDMSPEQIASANRRSPDWRYRDGPCATTIGDSGWPPRILRVIEGPASGTFLDDHGVELAAPRIDLRNRDRTAVGAASYDPASWGECGPTAVAKVDRFGPAPSLRYALVDLAAFADAFRARRQSAPGSAIPEL